MVNSKISGFYRLDVKKRLEVVAKEAGLSDSEVTILNEGLSIRQADGMIENVIGMTQYPIGVAVNFLINGKDYLIPMATEEPSVVAAASNAAKIARAGGGFKTTSTEPVMISQIQVTDCDAKAGKKAVDSAKEKIIELANSRDPTLVKFGGGCRNIESGIIKTSAGEMLIVHLEVDVRDAMGANAVNTMAEACAPLIEEMTGGKVLLRILSNYAVKRIVTAKAVFPKEELGGAEVVDAIISAYAFADADVYRAVTHNKGVMNGITAVVAATGNDTRAVEAGAHAYASMSGSYKPLTKYSKNSAGDLVGEIEMPLAVGLVGGATKTHPVAKTCVKILGVKTAQELAQVTASVGLAQNLAALKALATEGIQRGHMRLHAKNIAIQAGAKPGEIEDVVRQMVLEKDVRVDRAKEILSKK
ncbi:MAG TPA: hydroxymethylglutaryl-CoA reductase, degradative [Candidatus Altiarchaeales archaeon]|nr:hydroxymethylglutaryl-CoA reductase, degradative [Candidatus Altiarchaeales archaeon]